MTTETTNEIGIAGPPQMVGWHRGVKTSAPIIDVRLRGTPSVIWWDTFEWLLARKESDHSVVTSSPTNSLVVVPALSEHDTRRALAWTHELIRETNQLAGEAEAHRQAVEAAAHEWYAHLPKSDRSDRYL